MTHTITVLLLPPRAFCNNLVKAESLYGTLVFFPSLCSARALMTFPRQDRLMLIPAPSLRRSPVAPVESTRSLPAKSTRLMTAVLAISLPALFLFFWTKVRPTMVCALDEVAFMLVLATVRFIVPSSILAHMSS
jgi:hypothetical protein